MTCVLLGCDCCLFLFMQIIMFFGALFRVSEGDVITILENFINMLRCTNRHIDLFSSKLY